MVTNIKLNDGKYIATFEICDNNEDYSICNLGQKLTNDVIQINKTFIDIDIYKSQMQEKDQRIAELEQELAELKEKAIVPKFKVGQEVYYYHIARNKIYLGLVEDIQYFATRSGIFYRIPNLQRDYFWIREDELFATEQEAQAKLKEIQRDE